MPGRDHITGADGIDRLLALGRNPPSYLAPRPRPARTLQLATGICTSGNGQRAVGSQLKPGTSPPLYSGMRPSPLYVHVPFCARRCSYCDFSIAVRSRTPIDEYTTALRTELSQSALDGSTLETVYLGGGTPS